MILSDLHDRERDVTRAIRHLRRRKHEVVVFHVLDHAELLLPYRRLTEFEDMETGERLLADPQGLRGEYIREVEAFRRRVRRECADCRADYVAVDTATPFEHALMSYLIKRRNAIGDGASPAC